MILEALSTPGVMETATGALHITAEQFDPGVTINSDAAFMPLLRKFAGYVIAGSLIFLVAIIAIGGVLIGTGKIANTPGNQSKGFMVVVFGVIGAASAASAGALVYWATGLALAGNGGAGL